MCLMGVSSPRLVVVIVMLLYSKYVYILKYALGFSEISTTLYKCEIIEIIE